MTIRTILVDDEPLAIQGLELRLQAYDDVEIIAKCQNGREAISAIKTHKPDLVFLDIQMPGFDGFSVVQGLMDVEPPLFVFVTAYSDHAIRAFEAQATDYLMKPVEEARLAETLDRVRQRLSERGSREEAMRALAARRSRPGVITYDDPVVADSDGEEYRIAIDDRLHVHGETSHRGGREAADRLLDLPEHHRPTAMFCFNDRMATGAYTAIHARALQIPGDISIIGYDDQQFIAAEQDPPLTTIALPHYEMGRWAMEVALGIREGGVDAVHQMECPVIRRDSVGPPPAHVGKQNRRRTSQHTERSLSATPDR